MDRIQITKGQQRRSFRLCLKTRMFCLSFTSGFSPVMSGTEKMREPF